MHGSRFALRALVPERILDFGGRVRVRGGVVNGWEADKRMKDVESPYPQSNTSELEGQIDELVYQLYGLTEEEIAIVEGK